MSYLRTSDVARAAGVHPNTVRRYAEHGLIPPVDRGANGYRRFTQRHVDCMRVAHLIYTATYPGRAIRHSASRIIEHTVAGDWATALERAHAHLAYVRAERTQAEIAVAVLERWATGAVASTDGRSLRIGQVARLLGVSIDMLRNWERSGLITIPREPSNQYRAYGSAEISRLRVIRLLGRAGFSHMAMLRVLLRLDRGQTTQLRHALDTPGPEEDIYSAADRWLSTLAEQEAVALRLVALVGEISRGRTGRRTSS